MKMKWNKMHPFSLGDDIDDDDNNDDTKLNSFCSFLLPNWYHFDGVY